VAGNLAGFAQRAFPRSAGLLGASGELPRVPSKPSYRSARIATATLVVGCLALAWARPAEADHTQSTIFDPGGILEPGASAAYRSRTLDQIASVGADTVRIVVPWRLLAPQPDSSSPPAGFDGSDPADYPPGSFDALDQMVRGAEQRGLRLLLAPGGPAPDWASGSPKNDHVYPDPREFEDFVTALGSRYSGSCDPPSCDDGPLPRVSFWSVWNEPNLALFLRPQYRSGRSVSGRIYRGLFLAARRGLRDSGHGSDPVLVGDTAPSRGAVSTPPIAFLRDALCLDRHYAPQRDCTPIKAAGWAQHPYTPGVAPWQLPRSKDGVSIGSLGRLTRALRLAAAAGATEHRLPVYVTEFGIQSYPKPAKLFGVGQLRQAEYLGIAEYLLYRNRWVRSFAQYLMGDDAGDPLAHLTFNTGLRFADGNPKLAYFAFPITLVARRQGGKVKIWGHVRPRGGCDVQVSYLDPSGLAGSLGVFPSQTGGYFHFETEFRPQRRWRASCTLPTGRQLRGPAIRAYRFPN
jgi:hypothetical protein